MYTAATFPFWALASLGTWNLDFSQARLLGDRETSRILAVPWAGETKLGTILEGRER